jgi:hypothetical protein
MNGRCSYCDWDQNADSMDFPDRVRYPNLVSFNKARRLFEQGKPLIPSLEDFVGGLFFYREMHFEYKGKSYGVCLRDEEIIEFFENKIEESAQFYKTEDEFMVNAHIGGALLKDIWDEVENADYMS